VRTGSRATVSLTEETGCAREVLLVSGFVCTPAGLWPSCLRRNTRGGLTRPALYSLLMSEVPYPLATTIWPALSEDADGLLRTFQERAGRVRIGAQNGTGGTTSRQMPFANNRAFHSKQTKCDRTAVEQTACGNLVHRQSLHARARALASVLSALSRANAITTPAASEHASSPAVTWNGSLHEPGCRCMT
jgi:hypothetical protein